MASVTYNLAFEQILDLADDCVHCRVVHEDRCTGSLDFGVGIAVLVRAVNGKWPLKVVDSKRVKLVVSPMSRLMLSDD